MLTRDYERAKELARDNADEVLRGRLRRYDRVSGRLAIAGLLSFVLLFAGDWLTGRLLGPGHPGLSRLLTTLLPAIGIGAFLIGGDILGKRRGVVELARRLKAEEREKESG